MSTRSAEPQLRGAPSRLTQADAGSRRPWRSGICTRLGATPVRLVAHQADGAVQPEADK